MAYSHCCSHWLSQAVLPKYLVHEQPQSILNVERPEKSTAPVWSQEWCCGHEYLEWGSSQSLWVYFLHQRAAVLPQCHWRFPYLVVSAGHRQFHKRLSGIMKMLQAGKNPTVLSVRNCISCCLGTTAAQSEQGVPTGCVAGGNASTGQLCPVVCAHSDRVDAGWSAALQMLSWELSAVARCCRESPDTAQEVQSKGYYCPEHNKCLLAEVVYILISNLSSLFDKFRCNQSPQLGFDSSSLFTGILFFSYMPG